MLRLSSCALLFFFFHSLSFFGISDADNPLACNVAPPSNVRTVLGSCAEKKSRGVIPDKSFFFAFFLDNGAADLVNGVRAILPLVSRSSPRTYTLTLLGQLLVSHARAHTHTQFVQTRVRRPLHFHALRSMPTRSRARDAPRTRVQTRVWHIRVPIRAHVMGPDTN